MYVFIYDPSYKKKKKDGVHSKQRKEKKIKQSKAKTNIKHQKMTFCHSWPVSLLDI
jgi:hypothetical protein